MTVAAHERLTPTITCPTRERERDVKITVVIISYKSQPISIQKVSERTINTQNSNLNIGSTRLIIIGVLASTTPLSLYLSVMF